MAKEAKEAEEGAEGGLDSDDDGTSNKGKKKLIFIAIGVVVLLLAGAGGWFFMSGGEDHPAAEGEEAAAHEEAPAEGGEHGEPAAEGEHGVAGAVANAKSMPGAPVYYDIPEFLVDLNTSDTRKSSFLKMKVAVELNSAADIPKLEAYMPRVRDNFITYLRELRASDLSGSAGLYRLREELMLRINQAIAPAQVNNILFKEIVVQ